MVFKIDNKYEAGKEFTSGVWYFTTDKYNCDYKVYFTTDKYASDAKIFYVKDKFSAGLQK